MAWLRPWFYPPISISDYLRKYPLLFLFSFLSAFSWAFEAALRSYLGLPLGHGKVPGWELVEQTFWFGIPFFGLIHLALNSRWLKGFKYPSLVLAAGLALLYGFFLYFADAQALDTSNAYFQLFIAAVLAVFFLPLAWMEGLPKRHWAYLTNLVVSLSAGLLIWVLLLLVLNYIGSHLSYGSFVHYLRASDDFIPDLTGFLVIPWYLAGTLDRALAPPKGEGEEGMNLPAGWVWTFFVGLALLYLYDVFAVGKWLFTHGDKSGDANVDTHLYFLLALFSLALLESLRSRKPRKWMAVYPRVVAGLSLPLLAGAVLAYYRYYEKGPWDVSDYDNALFSVWLGGVFLYYLLKKNAGWWRPALAAAVLLAMTSVGPLSSAEYIYRDARDRLEANLDKAGMFLQGHVVKPAVEPDHKLYQDIVFEFSQVAKYHGLSGVQEWFTGDITGLADPEKDATGRGAAQRLMQMTGVEQCETMDYPSLTKSYQSGSRVIKDIAGFDQEQYFTFTGGCLVNNGWNKEPRYLFGLSDENEFLTIQYGGEFLADVPLAKLALTLLHYDYSEHIRHNIPPKDMTLEFENEKVKVRLYFTEACAFKLGKEMKISSGSGYLLVARRGHGARR